MQRNEFPTLSLVAFAVLTVMVIALPAPAAVIAGESFEEFAGAGLFAGGAPGGLDSDRFAVLGFSDGDSNFGDLRDGGDLARGRARDPVRTGGLYAFSLPGEQVGLGVQATSSDFSPGALLWKVQNTDSEWESLSLSLELWLRNDGPRSTQVSVELGLGDTLGPWIPLPDAGFETPAASDDLGWQQQLLQATLPVSLLAGEVLVFRLGFADATGSGGRDELALARLLLEGEGTAATPIPLTAPATLALLACAVPLLAGNQRRRTLAAVNEA